MGARGEKQTGSGRDSGDAATGAREDKGGNAESSGGAEAAAGRERGPAAAPAPADAAGSALERGAAEDGACGGILLAGGRSRRMGADKRLLEIGGRPVIERVAGLLSAVCGEVWLALAAAPAAPGCACGAGEAGQARAPEHAAAGDAALRALAARFPRLRVAADRVPDGGPLAGLHAGLAATRCRFNLAAAADMPFPSAALARELFAAARRSGRPAAVPEWDGRLHPLFAVYAAECLGDLQAYLLGGGRKVADWLSRLDPVIIPERRVRELDPTGRALFNMNRPEDYRQALAWSTPPVNGGPSPAPDGYTH